MDLGGQGIEVQCQDGINIKKFEGGVNWIFKESTNGEYVDE